MKLNKIRLADQFTLWFIGAVFLVTPICMMISYHDIKKNIYNTEVSRLRLLNNHLSKTVSIKDFNGTRFNARTSIKKIDSIPKKQWVAYTDDVFNDELGHVDRILTVISFYRINQQRFSLSSSNTISNIDMNWTGVIMVVLWKVLLIAFVVAFTGRAISALILSPFNQTLRIIEGFSLKGSKKINLPKSSVQEFERLNKFIIKMTDLAVDDYLTIKEFSENASHELQTPLAVAQAKLELLAETCEDEKQAHLISDTQKAIERMSRINRSLLLLTKLENAEFEHREIIDFGDLINEQLSHFETWITLGNLKITVEIAQNASLRLNMQLAEILFSNLLSNALKYNVENGWIVVSIDENGLEIKNPGKLPAVAPELYFQRFKKSGEFEESIGLGLSIVQQICKVSDLSVTFNYNDGIYTIKIFR